MTKKVLPPLPGEDAPGPEERSPRRKALDARGKQLEAAKKKAASAKRSLNAAQKKLITLEKVETVLTGNKSAIISPEDLADLTPTVQAYVEEEKVLFRPNPGPQTDFLASSEREVLYGGAAGGGKSMALIMDPMRYFGCPDWRGVIFRRTNDDLREIIFNTKQYYTQAFPGAKWSEQKSCWTFPSGANLWITYLDRDDDVLRYQGQAFQYVGFDELTHWPTPFPWNYMRSRLRTTNPDIPLFMRATTNPGGAGAHWVKQMFIDAAPWGGAFDAQDEDGKVMVWPDKNLDGSPNPRAGEALFQRRFIPARLQDNPYLLRDGQYEANLRSMPEAQRRQLLDGDWDIAEGAAFPEFRRSTHVCEPFKIPDGYLRFRAADWGYTSPACCLWFAIDYDNNLIVYRELYGKGRTADVFADTVKQMEEGESVRYGVLDGSAWDNRGVVGPTPAETMIVRGVSWRKADRTPNSRTAGKLEIHRRLMVNQETGTPRLIIFSNCVNLIRTLPVLPIDKAKPEDIDTHAEDHAYDALRYGIMSRPVNPANRAQGQSKYSGFSMADAGFGY